MEKYFEIFINATNTQLVDVIDIFRFRRCPKPELKQFVTQDKSADPKMQNYVVDGVSVSRGNEREGAG